MRYQNFTSFKKHLQNAYPNHLSWVYLILASDDYERKCAIDAILSYMPSAREAGLRSFSGDGALEQLMAGLYAPSLFDSGRDALIVADCPKEIKKKDAEALSSYFLSPQRSGRIILGFPSRQNLSTLFSYFEKEGVIFDLLEEKKWDKDKRLMESLQERIKEAGKSITSDAAAEFFARMDKDLAFFHNEADKLIAFTGDKKEIGKADVLAISVSSHSATLWQVAEAFVWKGVKPSLLSLLDSSSYHQLFSLIRSELRMGYKLRSLLEKGCPFEQLGAHFPGVFPKTLEKKREWAEWKDTFFFKKGLIALFQVELLSKNGISCVELLFDIFSAKVYS